MRIFPVVILIVFSLQFCGSADAPPADFANKSGPCTLRRLQAIHDFESGQFNWNHNFGNAYYVEEILFRRYSIKVSLPADFGICGLGSSYKSDSCSQYYTRVLDSLMTARFGPDIIIQTQKSADSLQAFYPFRYDAQFGTPVYIPNNDSMYADLRRVLRYPDRARRETVSGVVYIRIDVDSVGVISNATVIKGIRNDLDSAALTGVYQLGKFQPPMRWGIAQSASLTIPIRFVLE